MCLIIGFLFFLFFNFCCSGFNFSWLFMSIFIPLCLSVFCCLIQLFQYNYGFWEIYACVKLIHDFIHLDYWGLKLWPEKNTYQAMDAVNNLRSWGNPALHQGNLGGVIHNSMGLINWIHLNHCSYQGSLSWVPVRHFWDFLIVRLHGLIGTKTVSCFSSQNPLWTKWIRRYIAR